MGNLHTTWLLCSQIYSLHTYMYVEHTYTHTLKTSGQFKDVLHITWLLIYWRCLFCWIELHARYDWWVMVPNMQHNFFKIHHLCVHSHACITWKLQVVYKYSACQTTALLLKIFLVWFRVAWEIPFESYMYAPRQVSWTFSDPHKCVYTASPYTHRYLICNYAWQQNSHSLWPYYTTNDSFTAKNALSYKNKLG